MRAFPLSVTLLISGTLSLCFQPALTHAQEDTPGAPSLNQVLDRLAKLDDAWTKSTEKFHVILGQEETAKRITETAAQSLRWSLRNAGTAGYDSLNVIGSTRVPSGNAALTDAFRKLEDAYNSYQTDRTKVTSDALEAVRQKIAKAMSGDAKVEQIDSLIGELDSLQQALLKGSVPSQYQIQNSIPSAKTLLMNLRRVIEAEQTGNVSTLSMAVNELRNTYGDQQLASAVDRRARVEKAIKPYEAAFENTQKAVDLAIEQKKPVAEIIPALAKLEDANENLRTLKAYDGRQSPDIMSGYRTIVSVLEAKERGDLAEVTSRIQSAKGTLRNLGDSRAAVYEQMMAAMEREAGSQAAKIAKNDLDKLKQQINAVKTPADLDAIIAELSAASRRQMSRMDENRALSFALRQISVLSVAWKTKSLPFFRQMQSSEVTDEPGIVGEILALRQRIEREVLAQVLRVPELQQPPLAEKPLEEAVDAICDQLVKQREWRRLYQLLEARPNSPANFPNYDGRSLQDQTMTALRSYFAGNNFELAEQWSDAAEAYRAVLRTTSERAPIAEAAERLKALSKEHPEANKSANPARSGSNSPQ